MTVLELIKELQELPEDLPVVNDLKEITRVDYIDRLYYLDDSPAQYACSEAVILR